MRWMSMVAVAALSLVGVSPAFAASQQDSDEMPGLAEAVAFYHEHATSDLESIHEATKRFETLAIKRSRNWLAAYWTSFAYTQLGLFAGGERQVAYTNLAQFYLDRAQENLPEDGRSPERQADFHALNAMVLSFRSTTEPENAPQLNEQRAAAWRAAREADPENPMIHMSDAISLVQVDSTRNRAHEVGERAIELYAPRMDTVYPNWGREFLDVWLGEYPKRPGSRGEDE